MHVFTQMRYFIVISLAVSMVGCAKQRLKRSSDELGFDELKEKARVHLEKHETWEAQEALENLVHLYPDNKQTASYRINLADLFFEHREYERADEQYRRFLKMNPSTGEYASYRSILSKFYQTLTIDRDPTPLLKTIKRARKHLNNPLFSEVRIKNEIKDVLYTCEQKQIDREVYTFTFYLDHDKISSAESRLKELEKMVSPHNDLEARLLYLKSKLAKKKNDFELIKQNAELLAQNFADSPYRMMTERMLEHQSQGDKFLF